jgi:hypothetical protein
MRSDDCENMVSLIETKAISIRICGEEQDCCLNFKYITKFAKNTGNSTDPLIPQLHRDELTVL